MKRNLLEDDQRKNVKKKKLAVTADFSEKNVEKKRRMGETRISAFPAFLM
jgi:hypothetical protein